MKIKSKGFLKKISAALIFTAAIPALSFAESALAGKTYSSVKSNYKDVPLLSITFNNDGTAVLKQSKVEKSGDCETSERILTFTEDPQNKKVRFYGQEYEYTENSLDFYHSLAAGSDTVTLFNDAAESKKVLSGNTYAQGFFDGDEYDYAFVMAFNSDGTGDWHMGGNGTLPITYKEDCERGVFSVCINDRLDEDEEPYEIIWSGKIGDKNISFEFDGVIFTLPQGIGNIKKAYNAYGIKVGDTRQVSVKQGKKRIKKNVKVTCIKEYDAHGNIIREKYKAYDDNLSEKKYKNSYDANGLLTRVEGSDKQIKKYNSKGQIVEKYRAGEEKHGTRYEYNDDGELIYEDDSSLPTRYTWKKNADGTKTRSGENSYEDSKVTYDKNGRVISESSSAGVSTTYEYDSKGNVKHSVHSTWWRGSEEKEDTLYTYEYDENGNFTYRKFVKKTISKGYTPDGDVRSSSSTTINEVWYEYFYDANGKIILSFELQ
ncbi:RHS repeat domain-containing protein [Treponema zioleckii]|uniref:RHS repeat domain-containing protein n=1 Tax=Treponema zioleckii TaxID=331680 RepID=UPI00168A5DF1|nr:RHS repeat domain-containing protein [Treponema zioleckii]